jgi:purine-binding chemotaxis protein CheW
MGMLAAVKLNTDIPEEIVSVPCTPDFHLGVVSVRGCLWAVIDLCVFLGMSSCLTSDHPGLVLLADGNSEFCIAVDEILGVSQIPDHSIKALPKGENRISEYCLGITVDLKTVLDGPALLRDESLVVNEYVGTGR